MQLIYNINNVSRETLNFYKKKKSDNIIVGFHKRRISN